MSTTVSDLHTCLVHRVSCRWLCACCPPDCQDWVFWDRQSLELTLELNPVMKPPAQEVDSSMWPNNLPALMRFMELVRTAPVHVAAAVTHLRSHAITATSSTAQANSACNLLQGIARTQPACCKMLTTFPEDVAICLLLQGLCGSSCVGSFRDSCLQHDTMPQAIHHHQMLMPVSCRHISGCKLVSLTCTAPNLWR